MQKLFKFTKLKLIAGYLILLFLATVAIIFIYKETLQLTEKDPKETITQTKLFIISNTLAKLYEAEGIGIAFSQTNSKTKFNRYINLMKEVRRNMDTLKNLTTIKLQKKRIDTINYLLNQKIDNLKALMEVKQISLPEDFYNIAIERVEAIKDSTAVEPEETTPQTITTYDSVYTVKKRKGFMGLFSRRDTTLQVTIKHIPVDTITQEKPVAKTDSLVTVIKSAWDEFQQQNQEMAKEVYRKEIAVIQSGQNITERIKRILSDLENEEFDHTITKMEQQQQLTHSITRTIAWIAIISCVLVIVFISLIISDISQSQRYRKALEEAKSFTEKLLQSREQLMLTVTHDIKAPLSSIMGYIELLNNTSLEERQRYFLQNMKSSSEHILHLANNLLDFSKLESNKMDVDHVPYNPARLLQETSDSLQPLAAKKELILQSNISSALDTSYSGDPMKIRQIIINLLSNAIKYTREGRIELSAFVSPTQAETLIIVIKDSGPGMTREEQEFIFKAFTRLDAQHNNGAEGTGLGLTITQQLVQLLGGEISLESEKEIGSSFTVKLPLLKAVSPVEELPEKEETNFPEVQQLKALLVDDDPLQLHMSTELLRQKGIVCTSCNDPTKVLEYLEKERFDIILSDIQMPGMDGFELIEQIRRFPDPDIQKIPAIALSARGDMKENHYKKSGFSAYLNKPFTPQQLFECIAKLTGFSVKIKNTEGESVTNNLPYDLNSIKIFADHDPQAIKEIIRSFIRDCETNFSTLAQLLDKKEFQQIGRLSHKMLPMFRQFAIKEIIPLLAFLEQTDSARTPETRIKEQVEQIIRQGKTILEELKKEL